MKRMPPFGLLLVSIVIVVSLGSCGESCNKGNNVEQDTSKVIEPDGTQCVIGATVMGSHNNDSGGSYCWGAGICVPNAASGNNTVECTYCFDSRTRLFTIKFDYSELVNKNNPYAAYFQDQSGMIQTPGTITFDNPYFFYSSGNPIQFFVPLSLPADIQAIPAVAFPYTYDPNTHIIVINVQF